MKQGNNGRRFITLLIAGSLGLNVTLAVILLTQNADRSSTFTRSDRRPQSRQSSDWRSRTGSFPDSLRQFPRLERDQIERLGELRRGLGEKISPYFEEIHQLQEMMREELRSNNPELARLDSMSTGIARLQNQIQQHTFRLILQEREILTPEQYRMLTRFMMPGWSGQLFDTGRGGRGDDRGSGDQRRRGRESTPPPPRSFQE